MTKDELIEKLREGVGSAELSAEVAYIVINPDQSHDSWILHLTEGLRRGDLTTTYDLTYSLDATEDLMKQRFSDVIERFSHYANTWEVSVGVDDLGEIGYSSGDIKGLDAHACARCIILLEASGAEGMGEDYG